MERPMFGWDFEVDAWSRFLGWNLIKICVWTCDMNSTLGSVVPLAMFTLFISSLTWAVALGSAVEREVFPTAQALHVLSIRYPLRFLLAFHPFFLLVTFCLPKWAPIPNDPTLEQHLAFQRSSKWVANAVLAAPTILLLRQRCWCAKTAQLKTS